jgi:hypothetical protein
VTLALTASAAHATDYYVSPSGDDRNVGTSAATPWRTFTNVNARNLAAGDRVLLEGSQSFPGGLTFDAMDRGTAMAPITVSTYGTGRATLRPTTTNGIYAYNVAGLAIANLVIVGPGAATSTQSGINFYADLAVARRLPYVRIDNVEASGFRNGVLLGSWGGSTGYDDVAVTGCDLHDNAQNGLLTYGQVRAIHRNVRVTRSRFHDNLGDPLVNRPTGNGVNLGEVDGGLIERCVAWNNGISSRRGQGPVGIWAYNSNAVTIQFCESYANRTSGNTDGGGFDLDINMTNSVMQYNYSHDNDGAGYGLYQGTDALPWRGNVVRYNISENDGRRNGYGAITAWTDTGPFADCDIYGNTIFVSPSASGEPRAIRFNSVSTNFRFFNNLIVTTGGVRVIDVVAGQTGLVFRGNNYWTSGGAFTAVWAGVTHPSLAAWSAATGQERDGATVVGRGLDPLLTAPGMGGRIGDPDRLATLDAYRLRAGSPMINTGLDLSRFGVTPGARDYFGTSLPQGGALDVGAHEFVSGVVPPVDAGADAAADVARDVTADLGADGSRDVAVDTGLDVAADARLDAADAPADAAPGADVAVAVDASADAAEAPADAAMDATDAASTVDATADVADEAAGDSGADVVASDGAGDAATPSAPGDTGCQCSVPRAAAPVHRASGLVLAALAWFARRRVAGRRRPRNGSGAAPTSRAAASAAGARW